MTTHPILCFLLSLPFPLDRVSCAKSRFIPRPNWRSLVANACTALADESRNGLVTAPTSPVPVPQQLCGTVPTAQSHHHSEAPFHWQSRSSVPSTAESEARDL
ncbi:hypothetical protein B0T24DRAFT_622150 [Lasiosphaeria ovina]|uniref:Secreted protein n=1 Tax=Lasiosphaeria ovina TaxID=92902 RepID=A0AAE0KBE8_9PEZI|nr:hypothetical protein B0T24DRAFT_622150 [Lasiosphaeria ovina]